MAAAKNNGVYIVYDGNEENYAIISAIPLRDVRLSYGARGMMAIFADISRNKGHSWHYSCAGLAAISRDGVDAVKTILRELEKYGYLKRERRRDANGRWGDSIWRITPAPQAIEPPAEKPPVVLPQVEKQALSNKEVSNKEVSSTDSLSRDGCERDETGADDIAIAITTAAAENGVAISAAAVNKAAKTAKAAGMTTALVVQAVAVTAMQATSSEAGYLLRVIADYADKGYHDVSDIPAQNTGNAPNMGKNPALDYHQKTYTEDELQHIVLRPGGGEVAT